MRTTIPVRLRRRAAVAASVVAAALMIGIGLAPGFPPGTGAGRIVLAVVGAGVIATGWGLFVRWMLRLPAAAWSRRDVAALPPPWGRRLLLGRGPVPPPWSADVGRWLDQGIARAVPCAAVGLYLVGQSLMTIATYTRVTPGTIALHLAFPALVLAGFGTYLALLVRARRTSRLDGTRPSPVPRPVSRPSSARR